MGGERRCGLGGEGRTEGRLGDALNEERALVAIVCLRQLPDAPHGRLVLAQLWC